MLITPTQVAAASQANNVFAMGIVMDTQTSRVLLEIPNDLGWRYHYGCRAVAMQKQTERKGDATLWFAAMNKVLHQEEERFQGLDFVPAGRMYFEFHKDSNQMIVDPMLVHVFLADFDQDRVEGDTTIMGGKWYDLDAVPYENMWADDPLWMPDLLKRKTAAAGVKKHSSSNEEDSKQDSYYFEGTFVFDGPPGTGTLLKDHTVHVYPSIPF